FTSPTQRLSLPNTGDFARAARAQLGDAPAYDSKARQDSDYDGGGRRICLPSDRGSEEALSGPAGLALRAGDGRHRAPTRRDVPFVRAGRHSGAFARTERPAGAKRWTPARHSRRL